MDCKCFITSLVLLLAKLLSGQLLNFEFELKWSKLINGNSQLDEF